MINLPKGTWGSEKSFDPQNKPTKDRIEAIVSFNGVTEYSDYLKVAGFKLQKKDFGKPTHEDIEINPQTASYDIPQAWSQEIGGITYWLYNFPGAIKEAESLNVRIPSREEYERIFKAISGNTLEKARILNMPLVGYRNMNNWANDNQWKRVALWTTLRDGNMGVSTVLQKGCTDAHENLYGCGLGLSVRGLLINE